MLGPDILAPELNEAGILRRLREDDPTRADRRRAARPADHRRDRQPVEGRGLLRRRDRPVAAHRRRLRRGGAPIVRATRPRMQESARDGMQERFKVVYGTAGQAVPALRRVVEHPVPRAGRRQPDDILVSTMSALRRIGHKGADLIVPGNTPASFDAALAHGVDMIEFDVLEHRGPSCCSPTTTSTSRARRRSRRASRTSRAAPFDGVELDVDLKLPGYEERAVDALREYGLVERTLISSNWMRSLIVLRALEPRLRLGWCGPAPEERPDADVVTKLPAYAGAAWVRAKLPSAVARATWPAGRCDALMAHWRLVSPRLVRAVKRVRRRALRVDRRRRAAHRPARAARRHRGHHQRPAAVRSAAERAGRGGVAGRVGARAERWPASVATSGWRGSVSPWRQRNLHDAAQRDGLSSACANVKLQPDSTGAPFAVPTCAPAGVGVLDVVPAPVRRPVLRRGSASRAAHPWACRASTRGCRSRQAAWPCRRR